MSEHTGADTPERCQAPNCRALGTHLHRDRLLCADHSAALAGDPAARLGRLVAVCADGWRLQGRNYRPTNPDALTWGPGRAPTHERGGKGWGDSQGIYRGIRH